MVYKVLSHHITKGVIMGRGSQETLRTERCRSKDSSYSERCLSYIKGIFKTPSLDICHIPHHPRATSMVGWGTHPPKCWKSPAPGQGLPSLLEASAAPLRKVGCHTLKFPNWERKNSHTSPPCCHAEAHIPSSTQCQFNGLSLP